jgi:transposase
LPKIGYETAMPRKKQISSEEKLQVRCWAEAGISTAEIAKRLGRHIRSIQKVIVALKKVPANMPPPPPGKRSGRPKLVSYRMMERLRLFISRNPFKTAREVKQELLGFDNISVRRIQELLQKNLKMPAKSAAKKPLLTAKMTKKRLAFCRKYLKWTPKQWENVMFSDESTFRLVNSRASIVRRPKGISRYKQRYTIPTVKHSASVMVWGCFSGKKGRGGLYFLPKNCTMNGPRYKTVLEDHLLPFMRIHGAQFFLQDGAPCHTSKVVMNRLKEMKAEFSVLDWPGNSPDLNPIENCWSYMKLKLKAARFDTTSLPKLIHAIKKMWVEDMPSSYFLNLAHSMPRRLKAVIDNKGQMTKY